MELVLQLSTYNSARFLPALFDSLNAQTDRNWTLIVRDDGSAPEELAEIAAVLESYRDRLPHEWITGNNVGFAGSHQFMFERSATELVLLLNHDVVLTPTYIATLRDLMEREPGVGAAEGVMLRCVFDDTGKPRFTTTVDSLGFARTRYHKVYDLGAGKEYSPITEPIVDRFGVSGCLPMYRRSALGARLFDPSFWMYKEDVDVAYRLQKTGWRSVLVSSAVAYHGRGFQASRLHMGVSERMQEYSYINHWKILIQHLTVRDWLRDGWAIIPFETVKAGFMLIFHPGILYRTLRSAFDSSFGL